LRVCVRAAYQSILNVLPIRFRLGGQQALDDWHVALHARGRERSQSVLAVRRVDTNVRLREAALDDGEHTGAGHLDEAVVGAPLHGRDQFGIRLRRCWLTRRVRAEQREQKRAEEREARQRTAVRHGVVCHVQTVKMHAFANRDWRQKVLNSTFYTFCHDFGASMATFLIHLL
jgi:hypothetical protein